MAMTKRGERTKESFRSGARQVIAQKGFLRTTISEIAAAAGRSPASFYNYYDSKEALLEELADDFRVDTLKRQQMTIEPGTPIYDVMLASAAAYWESYKTHLARRPGLDVRALLLRVAGPGRRLQPSIGG